MHKFLLLSCIIMMTSFATKAQVINGRVIDENGDGLPGVNILLKGTTSGTITDATGSFTLSNASPEDVLVFSFVGYQSREVLVGDQTEIEVVMQPEATQLGEVVVTALGIAKEKKSLGYASQTVDGESLTTAGDNNVINALAGRVSGVQINQAGTGAGGTSKVIIRGYSSIAGDNSPLYVVDGIPINNPQGGGGQFGGVDYGDGISNINPEDIESINVLKGASATALYGSRGQNGVIMITTKKGTARQGIGVDFASGFTVETPLVLPEFQDRFGRGSNGEFALTPDGNVANTVRVSWGPRTRGQTEANGFPLTDWNGEVTPYTTYPDNIEDYFRTGKTYVNSLGLSAGGENTRARLSLSHFYKDNIMPNSNLERININLNVLSYLTKKLTVEGKLNYIRQDAYNRPNLTLSPDNPMNSLIQMPRSIDLDDLRNYQTADGRPVVYTNATGVDQWQNPFWAAYLNTNNDTRDRVIGYIKIDYQFTDWLSMFVRTGTDFYNDYRQFRNATNTIYRVTPDQSYYSVYYGKVEERNSDFLLTATRQTGDLDMTFNVGGNLRTNEARSNNQIAQGLNIPNFFVIQNALSTISSEGKSQKEVQSVYGSAQIGYKDYLFLEVSGRNDWSSALPADARSYFYPSISGSLIVTDAFDLNSGVLNFGKLRASYAQVGNDTGPHQLDQNYVVNGLTHGGQNFGQIIQVQPPVNLKPERTTSVEVGFELGMFENRLTADFTYYHAGTRNQILRVPVSKPSGFQSSLINAGLIVNQGVEIGIRGDILRKNAFNWEAYLNFTHNKSTVEELAPNVDVFQLGGTYDQFGVRIQAEVGGEFGDIYADRAYLRDPVTGERIIGDNGLPVPDPSGIKKIGNYQPDFLAGFGNNLRYKNFTLGVLFDIRKGGDIYSFSNAIAAANGNALYTQYDRLEWYAGAGGLIADGITESGEVNSTEVNPQTYWQYVGGRASAFAEEFLYDGSFIKLRELQIGYSLPGAFLENTPFTDVRFSIVGRNLFILHKNTPGFDPEATFNAGNDQGIEAFAFPSTRSIGFNLNVKL